MSDKNLKGLRNKIDKIDQELYALIQKRASNAVAIGKIKSKVTPKSSFYKPDSCLLYTSPSPRDGLLSRMPSSA